MYFNGMYEVDNFNINNTGKESGFEKVMYKA